MTDPARPETRLSSSGRPRRRSTREGFPYLLPWLVSALTFVLFGYLTGVVVGAMGAGTGVGLVSGLLALALPLVSAAAGVVALRRSSLELGMPAWLIAGMPAPVLFCVVNVVRASGSAPESARGTVLVALVVGVLGAAFGSLLAGLLRSRTGRRAR